jgi:antitoxin (DNA-binding transcriptional repressor) of toxin-antitoxin stability system
MNKVVPIEEVERTLAALAESVGAGEMVVVTKDGVPVFDLVPHQGAAAPSEAPRKGGLNWQALEDDKKKHGIDQIVTWIADDFDAPITGEEFLEIWEPGPDLDR